MMQLLFAAPFIAAALLTFVVCIVIPSARRHAFPCVVAILAAGPGVILGFVLMTLLIDRVIHMKDAGNAWYLAAATGGGILASLVAALSVRIVLRLTPATVLRWIVFGVCFVNLFVIASILLLASLHKSYVQTDGRLLAVLFLTLPVFVSVYPSVLLARNSEEFRPTPFKRSRRAFPIT